MFTKKKWVGSAHAYKNVIDWDAVGGAVVLGFIALVVIGALNGG